MCLTDEGEECWKALVGGSFFSAIYPVVQAMAAAQRWPQLTGRVYLATLEFSFLEIYKPQSTLEMILDVEEKRKGWFWYSFKTQIKSNLLFAGSAVISTHQNADPPRCLPPSLNGEKICRLFLDGKNVIQYLEISGDPNPIHRQGGGNMESVYPGLLLLGQLETALKTCLHISLADYAVKVKFYSPVFADEFVDVAIVRGEAPRFEILISNRVAAIVSCNLNRRQR